MSTNPTFFKDSVIISMEEYDKYQKMQKELTQIKEFLKGTLGDDL